MSANSIHRGKSEQPTVLYLLAPSLLLTLVLFRDVSGLTLTNVLARAVAIGVFLGLTVGLGFKSARRRWPSFWAKAANVRAVALALVGIIALVAAAVTLGSSGLNAAVAKLITLSATGCLVIGLTTLINRWL